MIATAELTADQRASIAAQLEDRIGRAQSDDWREFRKAELHFLNASVDEAIRCLEGLAISANQSIA